MVAPTLLLHNGKVFTSNIKKHILGSHAQHGTNITTKSSEIADDIERHKATQLVRTNPSLAREYTWA